MKLIKRVPLQGGGWFLHGGAPFGSQKRGPNGRGWFLHGGGACEHTQQPLKGPGTGISAERITRNGRPPEETPIKEGRVPPWRKVAQSGNRSRLITLYIYIYIYIYIFGLHVPTCAPGLRSLHQAGLETLGPVAGIAPSRDSCSNRILSSF